MEWFDKEFFEELGKIEFVQGSKTTQNLMNEPTGENLPCERLEKERDYWKDLFEKEKETNKKLTDTIYKLIDYLG